MTTLVNILHSAITNNATEANAIDVPYRIPGLTFKRLKSDVCDDVFLMSMDDIHAAIQSIETENVYRHDRNEPLERNLSLFVNVDLDGTKGELIVQFDLEAVRSKRMMLNHKDDYNTHSGVIVLDNGSLEDDTLSARLIIYNDYMDSKMTFDILGAMDALSYECHESRLIGG